MANQPFYASTTGDPASLTRMIAFQTDEFVPALDSALVPYKSYGGPLTPSPKRIARHAILPQPMRELSMRGKVETDGRTLNMGDLDAGNAGQLINLISLMGGYDLATASGHTRWRLSQQMAAEHTAVLKKWTHINDSNKGIPIRHTDCLTRSLSLSIAKGANADLVFGVEAGRFDFWGVPTVTGTGIVKPILRGTNVDMNFAPDATDGVVFIKIISDSATEVVFQAKVGTAGTYSSNQTATKGEWCFVYLGNATATIPLGGRAAQCEIYFAVNADNSFVDADVWQFPKRRLLTVVDGDYPTPAPVAETQFRFVLDGTPIYADGGVTITADVPNATTRYVAGGEQAIGTDRFGQVIWKVVINRKMADMEFQQALMQAAQVSLIAEGRNDLIVGSSAYYYGMTFVLPFLDVEGAMHDAEAGAANKDEVMTMNAYKPDVDHDNFVYEGITDISADCEVIVDTHLVAADLGL